MKELWALSQKNSLCNTPLDLGHGGGAVPSPHFPHLNNLFQPPFIFLFSFSYLFQQLSCLGLGSKIYHIFSTHPSHVPPPPPSLSHPSFSRRSPRNVCMPRTALERRSHAPPWGAWATCTKAFLSPFSRSKVSLHANEISNLDMDLKIY